LWVRAIEEAEGEFPEWLAEVVDRRCRGFLKFVVQYKMDHPESPPFFWYYLERWIDKHIFGKAWSEGWMNAVGYYAVRDPASIRNNAYWEHCEREWKISKPAFYPGFWEWRKASEHCSARVLDECEMPPEKRELVKLSQQVGPRVLRDTIDQYLDWQMFAYWARSAIEFCDLLPTVVRRELQRRCHGFLQSDSDSKQRPDSRFNRLMAWIEDHEFVKAKEQGWFNVVVYQASLHPRQARVVDYWREWQAQWSERSLAAYPRFKEWKAAADNFIFAPKVG